LINQKLEPFRRGLQVYQTDGQTDRLPLAIARPNIVRRALKTERVLLRAVMTDYSCDFSRFNYF